jgi:ATP-dependent RNA helicase RhlE
MHSSSSTVSTSSFSHLGLCEPILRSLIAEGYTTPTPIQAQAIGPILEGRDVLGCAQTGTGKTAAFALPILDRLGAGPASSGGSGSRHIRALVLSPTRELSAQIDESFRTYGRHLPLKSTVIYGGVSQHRQEQALRGGVDVLVATPGRLLDLVNQGIVDLRHVQTFVLDEGDQMLDMGFIHDIRRIITRLPAQRQNLLFSATMPAEIRRLAGTILREPVSVQVTPVASTLAAIEQTVYFVEKRNKPQLLTHFLSNTGTGRALVFTRTKHGADKVARHLERSGIPSRAIHGGKNQGARHRAIAAFKSDEPPVLVATDIAARGLDIDGVSHVVNYDVPNVPETYVHRIGRTGRAGASGAAVSFCDAEEREYIREIERLTRRRIAVVEDHPQYIVARPAAHEGGPRPHAPAAAAHHHHHRPVHGRQPVHAHAHAHAHAHGARNHDDRRAGQRPHSAPSAGATATASGSQNRFRGHKRRRRFGGQPGAAAAGRVLLSSNLARQAP